jgi:hypothetical protein
MSEKCHKPMKPVGPMLVRYVSEIGQGALMSIRKPSLAVSNSCAS